VRRIRVVRKKRGKGWVAKRGSKIVASGTKKTTTVKKAAKVARNARKPTSLRIHKRNGQFQEERTYPRSADPKGSKG
jgi:hypothetical protein